MKRFDHLFVVTKEQEQRLATIGGLADSFKDGAKRADEENGFAYEHIAALREIGYFSYPVPKSFGGQGISLYELVMYQERLAQADAATALAVGWHLSVVHDMNFKKNYSPTVIEQLNREIVEKQVLLNKAVTEKTSGSPTRGGKMLTTAVQLDDGSYKLNGRKTFTSLSPALDYFIVIASLENGEAAEFIFPRNASGVVIEETWDMVGMRGTASHDLVMNDVIVPQSAMLCKTAKAATPSLLHIPACYLGIALAARKEAIKFAYNYHPTSLPAPIIQLPHIMTQLGQIELELQAARHYMYSVAARWDRLEIAPELLVAELNAVKITAIQTALSVVDKAMRVVGAHSLSMDHPLQRMYRDVRFGLHNPPMEDAVLTLLGKQAITDYEAES